jgi:hypothetical protein
MNSVVVKSANKAFQRDEVAVSHLLQKAQKLRHSNFAPEQRRYTAQAAFREVIAMSAFDPTSATLPRILEDQQ